MAGKSKDSLRIHRKDSIEQAIDKNDKLFNMIDRLEKTVKKLKSECKTLKRAWENTEKKHEEIVKGITLQEILDHIQSGTPLSTTKESCKMCGEKTLNSIKCSDFYIVICGNCGHREKINERPIS